MTLVTKIIMVKRLTITQLYDAVKGCQSKAVEDSIKQYGIPKSGKKTTDYSILQIALDKNQKSIAKALIDAGCRFKPNNNDVGWTPLAYTVFKENVETATHLLNKGATPEAGNKSGLTVLHLAVRKKSLNMLRLLLCYMDIHLLDSKGKNVLKTFFEVICRSSYQVHVDQATLANNTAILKFLLSKEASLDFQNDPDGYAPLHYAVKSKQLELIHVIIEKTGNVNVLSKTGDTPLHVLLSEKNIYKQDYLSIVRLLVDKGANINIANNKGETLLHVILSSSPVNEDDFIDIFQCLINQRPCINAQNYQNESAGHIAARKKYLRVLHTLLKHKCEVNLQDYNGNTILHKLLQNSTNFRLNDAFVELVNGFLELKPSFDMKNYQGETLLHVAIQNKQSRLIKHILAKTTEINATDNNGNTVLHKFLIDLSEVTNYKIDNEDKDIIANLLLNGANVDLLNSQNLSVIHLAYKLENYEILIQVLERSENLDTVMDKNGRAILHLLIERTKVSSETDNSKITELVECCLKKGATIDMKDEFGVTPLYLAVMARKKPLVKVLLEYGADPNTRIFKSKNTVLDYLLKRSEHLDVDLEIAELLLQKGANIKEDPSSEFSIINYITLCGKLDMCSKLILYSENLEIVDAARNTALHKLLNTHYKENEDKVCNLAMKLAIKGNLIEAKNNEGVTPLHLALKRKLYKCAKFLINCGARSITQDKQGNCALHYLSMTSIGTKHDLEKEIVALLVKEKCNVNSLNNDGLTPLHYAISCGSSSMVKILISYKADVNLPNSTFLFKPLHVAVENNLKHVAEILIKHGAYVDAKANGKTALHMAVALRYNDVVRTLLEYGADTEVKDELENTPLCLAYSSCYADIMKILLNYQADFNYMTSQYGNWYLLSRVSCAHELVYHIKRMFAANMCLSRQILSVIDENFANNNVSIELKEEVTKLKEMKIDSQKSLVDVLPMSENRLAIVKNNENFQKIINDDGLSERFPHYGDMLKACYNHGVVRSDYLAQSLIPFKEILGIHYPDICCELILKNLTNNELKNVIEAAKLKSKTRKRNCDDDDAAPNAKRIRRVSM